MCMSTAATTASGSVTRSQASSSGRTNTRGTVIMMVRLVIPDSAVAAWPAPMLATSRMASSCDALRSRTSMPNLLLKERRGVQNQSRRTVCENGRTPDERGQSTRSIERLDYDVLLPDQGIHHQRGAAVADLQDD